MTAKLTERLAQLEAQLAELDALLRPRTPEAFAALLRSERACWPSEEKALDQRRVAIAAASAPAEEVRAAERQREHREYRAKKEAKRANAREALEARITAGRLFAADDAVIPAAVQAVLRAEQVAIAIGEVLKAASGGEGFAPGQLLVIAHDVRGETKSYRHVHASGVSRALDAATRERDLEDVSGRPTSSTKWGKFGINPKILREVGWGRPERTETVTIAVVPPEFVREALVLDLRGRDAVFEAGCEKPRTATDSIVALYVASKSGPSLRRPGPCCDAVGPSSFVFEAVRESAS